jgi:Domain of unknown function (DUF1840)
MIYTFRSKAAGDLIMLGEHGDKVMTLLGREPAVKGIFEAQDLPTLIKQLESAVDEPDPAQNADDQRGVLVGMKTRLWPLVEMMRRAQSAGEVIVWGV